MHGEPCAIERLEPEQKVLAHDRVPAIGFSQAVARTMQDPLSRMELWHQLFMKQLKHTTCSMTWQNSNVVDHRAVYMVDYR